MEGADVQGGLPHERMGRVGEAEGFQLRHCACGLVHRIVALVRHRPVRGHPARHRTQPERALVPHERIVRGRLGNAAGVLPAAALVLVLPEKLQVIQEYRFLLFSLFVILVLLFRPQGLFPRGLRQYLPGWGRR